MRYYIYKLTFKSGSTYIGEHLERKDNDGYITSSKYFKENSLKDPITKREILIELEDEETMHFMETVCIMQDKRDNPKNVNGSLGAYVFKYSSYRGRFVTEETRQKCSEASKRRKVTEDTKKKISEKQKGVKESNETRLKCSERMKGNKNRKGTKTSEEGRKHISEAKKRFYKNGGISPAKGKKFGPLSEERKEKIRQANLNRIYDKGYHIQFKNPEERAKKISEALSGVPGHSQNEDTKKRISEKMKGTRVITNGFETKRLPQKEAEEFLSINLDWRYGRPRKE